MHVLSNRLQNFYFNKYPFWWHITKHINDNLRSNHLNTIFYRFACTQVCKGNCFIYIFFIPKLLASSSMQSLYSLFAKKISTSFIVMVIFWGTVLLKTSEKSVSPQFICQDDLQFTRNCHRYISLSHILPFVADQFSVSSFSY